MGIWYCTREDVKSALDFKESARNNVQIDRAIEAASRSIEGQMHRTYYPQVDTRYFDWPDDLGLGTRPWRLWLDENDLISVTTLTSGSVAISGSNFTLYPSEGPPYTRLELLTNTSASFGGGTTRQRSIAITGVFGYSADLSVVGSATEALDSSETGIDISSGVAVAVGVGSLIKIDSEYMNVTGKLFVDTGQNTTSAVDGNKGTKTIPVSTGSAFMVGEVILVNAEKMLITEIAADNLIVERAWDGSTLASHLITQDVFAIRNLTVERGAVGTTAATHLDAAPISMHVVPGGIRTLCIAEASVTLQQEGAAYARVVGEGENQREASGRGLQSLRKDMKSRYGRQMRLGVV